MRYKAFGSGIQTGIRTSIPVPLADHRTHRIDANLDSSLASSSTTEGAVKSLFGGLRLALAGVKHVGYRTNINPCIKQLSDSLPSDEVPDEVTFTHYMVVT